MTPPRSASSLVVLATIAASISPARAQSMDYTALQALFGEPITTSVTGTAQRASEVAANMTIITTDQIRQSGSRSIPQILSRVPGLDISQTTSVAYDVGVRGYQQQMQSRLLVLIDGRQVFQDDYSRTVWENLPVNIDDIRQIEVVKGPSSALFGSNAGGGVINIVTTNPLYDRNVVATMVYGTKQTAEGDTTASAKIADIGGVKISAGGMNGREFGTPRYNLGGVIGPEISAAQASAANLTPRPSNDEYLLTLNPSHRYVSTTQVFEISPAIQTDTEFSYTKSRSSEGYYSGRLDAVEDTVISARGGFTWQSPIGTIKNTNYWNQTRVANTESGTATPYYTDVEALLVSQWEDQFRIGSDHTFRLSSEYRHETFKLQVNQTYPQNPQIEENTFAVGGMWLWQISDALSWTNAARLDHVQLSETGPLWSGSFVSPNAYNHSLTAESANSGLVYKASDTDTFRLTYGRAIELPRLLDYGFNVNIYVPSINRSFERAGNPSLNPAIVTNYELDYDRKLTTIDSTLKLAGYYQINDSIMVPLATVGTLDTPLVPSLIPGQTTTLSQSINAGTSHGVGGEIQLAGQNSRGIRWDGSYSLAVTTDSPGIVSAGGDLDKNSTPKHHLRLLLGYTTGPWEFDVQSQYQTSYFSHRALNVNAAVDDYSSVTGRIAYTLDTSYTIALSGTNLAQAITRTTAFPAIQRQVYLSLTGRF